MNIWEYNIWQFLGFFGLWYFSIAFVIYKWMEEIYVGLFFIKLYLLVSIIAIQWLCNCGSQYYVITYCYKDNEKEVWRTIEFPPIW